MSVQPAVRELLERGHVPYQTFTHRLAYTAQEEAAAAHVPGRDWAKTIVCVADGQAILAVLPAPFVINFEKLRMLVGARRLRLATEEEMARWYPGCEVGAIPPLGPLYRQRVFVDRKLTQETDVVFSAGTHTDSIRMPYTAFATIAQPVVGDYGELPSAGKRSAAHDGRGLWM
jgi:Ala-tRNA(Pro) deacylase